MIVVLIMIAVVVKIEATHVIIHCRTRIFSTVEDSDLVHWLKFLIKSIKFGFVKLQHFS